MRLALLEGVEYALKAGLVLEFPSIGFRALE